MSIQENLEIDPILQRQNEALADFGFTLLRNNPKGSNESMIISPLSISIALAMCYVGARNNTSNQIAKVLGGESHPSISYQLMTLDDQAIIEHEKHLYEVTP